MKTARIFVLVAAAAALLVLPLARVIAEEAWEKSADMMYQHGWFLETAERDYEGAIAVYQKLIEKFGADKATCAKALLRIGVCYDGLGKKDEAKSAYEKVISNYPDQAAAVKEANLRLRGGVPPEQKESVEQYKKEIADLLKSPAGAAGEGFFGGSRVNKPAEFAEAYPDEAAEFLHTKLVEIGKLMGPEIAKGKPGWVDFNVPSAINLCLKALAGCDTEKARANLLDLLKRSNNPDGQFLGTDTAQAILTSFVYLKPKFVTDEVVDLVINSIKDVSISDTSRSGLTFMLTLFVWPGNPVVTNGFYELAVFASGNEKALKYLVGEAEKVKDEQRAQAAMVFLARVRKVEVVEVFQKIATGKYPEDTRRVAIVCIGATGTPYYRPQTSAPFFLSDDARIWESIRVRDQRYGDKAYRFQRIEYPGELAVKAVYPEKKLVDACLKALKAAFDFNNCVEMRGEVIKSIGLLGRAAAKAPLIEYAKEALDSKVREMAVIALGVSFAGFEKDKDVLAALQGLMKDDPSTAVKVQAAFSDALLASNTSTLFYYRTTIPLPREAIIIVLDALKKYVSAPGIPSDNIAINVTPYDAVNALYSTTFHAELIQEPAAGKPLPVSIAKAVDTFEKWWEANKDKSESEWALAGMEEWIRIARDFIAGKEGVVYPMYSQGTLLTQAIQILVKSDIGMPPSTGRPMEAVDYQKAFLQMVCDWWDKNKEKVTWNPEKRYFEVKAGAE